MENIFLRHWIIQARNLLRHFGVYRERLDISSMPGAGQPDINMTYFNLGELVAPDGELLQMALIPEFISEYLFIQAQEVGDSTAGIP